MDINATLKASYYLVIIYVMGVHELIKVKSLITL